MRPSPSNLQIWFVFAGFLFVTPPLSASLDQAMEMYQAQQYQQAYAMFSELAAIGNHQAQYMLGIMYSEGQGVDRDQARAYAWIQVANETLDNTRYRDVSELLFLTMSAQDKQRAQDLTLELISEFGSDALNNTLYPKPLNDAQCSQEYSPISKVTPRYPATELMRGNMGIVEVEFTISPQGYVRDLIASTYTSEDFARSASVAAHQFRYQPRIRNNQAVPVHGVMNRIVYFIETDPGDRITNQNKLKQNIYVTRDKAMQGNPMEQFKYAAMLNAYRPFSDYLDDVDVEYQEANRWYLSSATAGQPNAQFILGRNMVQGLGCEVDEEHGMRWINLSAAFGYAPAQRYLAQSMINNPDAQRTEAAVKWLRNSVENSDYYYPSKVLLAWELATSPLDSIRNGAEALSLLREKPTHYYDEVRVLETRAAAHAELGEFSPAVRFQKDAIKKARRLGWSIPVMMERLDSYQNRQAWRGEYYPPEIPADSVSGN